MRRPCAWRASLLPATEVVDLQQQAARLAEAVREAGALALSMFKTPLKNWTKGEALSPVSDADIAVDVLLRERLTSNNESIAWLSEESVDDPARLDARYVWIVDPIDGTRAYIAGLPVCAGQRRILHSGHGPGRQPQRRRHRRRHRHRISASARRRPEKVSRSL